MDTAEAMKELAQIPERASASHCFGTAVSSGEHTVIPVAEVSYGVGLCWGSGGPPDAGGGGGGGGGGGRARGIAVIEVSASGVRVHPVYDQTAITLAGITFASSAAAIVSKTLLRLIRG